MDEEDNEEIRRNQEEDDKREKIRDERRRLREEEEKNRKEEEEEKKDPTWDPSFERRPSNSKYSIALFLLIRSPSKGILKSTSKSNSVLN